MAKAESKTILKAYSTVESKLPTLPLEDGQLIFVYDKKKIILDNHGVRTVYEQIQTIETEEQRNDLLAPIDSFYFVIETSILWRYSNGHWNQITTSPQEQIDRISAEGTKQVKAIQDKGTEVLQSIPEDFATQMETKLDKQQGIENKGKVLVIGEDGNVVPEEVSSGGGDGIAIINTMSGESPLVIPDSAERVNKGLELGGKTEQVSTRGVNLFDVSKVVSNNDVIRNGDGDIKVIANESNNGFAANTPNTLKDYCPLLIVGQTYTLSANTAATTKQIYLKESGAVWTYGESVQITKEMLDSVVLFYSDVNKTSVISNIQIERGSTATAYEPYTGGKPSTSPEYPQEIKNVGKWNEETQKYEVGVKITNAEQNWSKEQTLTLTSDRPITKWDRLVEQGGQIGWLYKSKIIDGFDGQSSNITLGGKQGKVQHFSVVFADTPNGNGNGDIYVDRYRAIAMSYTKAEFGICCNWNSGVKFFSAPNENVTTVQEFKTWLAENPLVLVYETISTEFIPLPQSEQNAIRALKTYYPTTVITVDGGELDPDIKVTYTADTKNYIDNKFGKTINAMQTKLLELESRV